MWRAARGRTLANLAAQMRLTRDLRLAHGFAARARFEGSRTGSGLLRWGLPLAEGFVAEGVAGGGTEGAGLRYAVRNGGGGRTEGRRAAHRADGGTTQRCGRYRGGAE